MRTHVIILAQGRQTRMASVLRVPKQLVQLPAHQAAQAHNTTILGRTLMMVCRYLGGVGVNLDADAKDRYNDHRVTVVAWPTIKDFLYRRPVRIKPGDQAPTEYLHTPQVITLAEPGNSSLVGINRYLTECPVDPDVERVVILLGDVCYSWDCLRICFRGNTNEIPRYTFVGTPVLDEERGEIWGAMWRGSSSTAMMAALAEALKRSSSEEADEYQPGQLRHWYWALRGRLGNVCYCPVEDYTMDLDLPEQLVQLTESSLQALADDREHGAL